MLRLTIYKNKACIYLVGGTYETALKIKELIKEK